jgi:hypothetical protein
MIISAPDKPQETHDPHPLAAESILPGPPPSAPVTRLPRRRRIRLAIYAIALLSLAFVIHSTRRRSRGPHKPFLARPPFQAKQSHFTPERLPHLEKTFLYALDLLVIPRMC